jgi:hypothetical protein
MGKKPVVLHAHAKERAAERGATEDEVVATIRRGGTLYGTLWAHRFSAQFFVWRVVARPAVRQQAGRSVRERGKRPLDRNNGYCEVLLGYTDHVTATPPHRSVGTAASLKRDLLSLRFNRNIIMFRG